MSGFDLLFQFASGANFFFGDVAAIFGAEEVLEQDAQRERQVFGGDSLFVEGVEAVDFVGFVADFQVGVGVETINGHDGFLADDLARMRYRRASCNPLV